VEGLNLQLTRNPWLWTIGNEIWNRDAKLVDAVKGSLMGWLRPDRHKHGAEYPIELY
jgi:hypothetical protein